MTRHTIVEENTTFPGSDTFLELGACWWTDERIFLTSHYSHEKVLAEVIDIRRSTDGVISAEFKSVVKGLPDEELGKMFEYTDFGVELHQLARNNTKREGLITIEKGRIMSVAIIPPSPGFPRMNLSDIEVPYYGD